MLGLFAFFYAVAARRRPTPGSTRASTGRAISTDVTKRKFIFVGFAAFVLLIPLARHLDQRRRAAPRLRALEAAPPPRLRRGDRSASIHFVWRVKKDVSEPLAYGAVLAALLLVRVVVVLRARRAE